MFRKLVTALLILTFGVLLLPRSGFAEEGSTVPTDVHTRIADVKDDFASREGEAKLQGKERACEVRKEGFERRKMLRPRMATEMLRLFDTILKRTEEFYTTKVVPAGGSVPNYDSLVADTASKSAAVKTAVQALKDAAPVFDCTKPLSGDTGLGNNKQLLENVKTAIKDYRLSVKTLVKAVREAARSVLKEKEPKGTSSAEVEVHTNINSER